LDDEVAGAKAQVLVLMAVKAIAVVAVESLMLIVILFLRWCGSGVGLFSILCIVFDD
jgi:hypothetical protein